MYLHGECGAALFEHEVPDIHCTRYGACEEHSRSGGTPATISQW